MNNLHQGCIWDEAKCTVLQWNGGDAYKPTYSFSFVGTNRSVKPLPCTHVFLCYVANWCYGEKWWKLLLLTCMFSANWSKFSAFCRSGLAHRPRFCWPSSLGRPSSPLIKKISIAPPLAAVMFAVYEPLKGCWVQNFSHYSWIGWE